MPLVVLNYKCSDLVGSLYAAYTKATALVVRFGDGLRAGMRDLRADTVLHDGTGRDGPEVGLAENVLVAIDVVVVEAGTFGIESRTRVVAGIAGQPGGAIRHDGALGGVAGVRYDRVAACGGSRGFDDSFQVGDNTVAAHKGCALFRHGAECDGRGKSGERTIFHIALATESVLYFQRIIVFGAAVGCCCRHGGVGICAGGTGPCVFRDGAR